ncbi:hypothetical protein HNY73_018462 [Argiope bruennichi]|uniref:AFP-like domain-containing protein n=1 Tax=Argiope bruennichi TaxID=94029 RepID=A0A8T0EDX6_ARGBR|nr:hypothetical protein HNY73_018462 [Argiope bruennichi]
MNRSVDGFLNYTWAKPSHLLRKMRELGGGTGIKDDFLKTLWLQRLPSEMQEILSISSEPLDNLANMVDKIAVVRISSTDNSVFAVSRGAESTAMRKASTLDEFTALRSEIAALSTQPGKTIVAARFLASGTYISEEDMAVKVSLGKNFHPLRFYELIGRRLKKAVEREESFTPSHFY